MKATSGGTTRLTVSRTSNPFEEADTTSAPAGLADASKPTIRICFMAPPSSGGCHSVEAPDQALGFVEGKDRRRLGPVLTHAGADRFLIVVRTALELCRPAS